jgi:hypothetical protein
MVGVLNRDHRLPAATADKTYLAQLLAADWKTRLIKLADVYDHLAHAGSQQAKRKRKAEQALALATGTEPSIVLARRLLEVAIKAAS